MPWHGRPSSSRTAHYPSPASKNAPVFVDTNVFLYALDHADRKKQAAARAWRAELWKNRLGRISFQVLQEFYVKATQKWPETRDEVRAEIKDLLAWQPVVE